MKQPKRILNFLVIIIICTNIIAIFHAYRFTHFSEESTERTPNPDELSFTEKLATLLFGVSFPKSRNHTKPSLAFETIRLGIDNGMECWKLTVPRAKGTVILFHGYGGTKATMLDKAEVFRNLGYNTLLPDFTGNGGSKGYETTIGFYEAKQVKTCYEYLQDIGEQNIILFGTSMGAAAILKALNDYEHLRPTAALMECPFGSMYETVCARFQMMNIPAVPMAGLLVFWGGTLNGFNAFAHNPAEYATEVKTPTLLMYGAKDEKVSLKETQEIFTHLNGPKALRIYPNASHENYLIKYRTEWTEDVSNFLQTHAPHQSE